MDLVEAKMRRALVLSTVLAAALAMTGCQSGPTKHVVNDTIESDPNEAFSAKEYGVPASPRVTNKRIVRKGGGRSQVGKPYKVRGKWYYPKEEPGYAKSGNASWYGSSFHGRLTANGEIYDMFGLSAAHPTFPLPSYARVTNLKTGSQVMVRVNDRGPYAHGRVMDLSSKAAEMLGYKREGIGKVKVEYVGRAPIEGDDTRMLMATYRPGKASRTIDDGLPSGVMIAGNESRSRPVLVAGLVQTASPVLPGVRSKRVPAQAGGESQAAIAEAITVGSIIGDAAALDPDVVATVPVPTPRGVIDRGLVVSSYAPEASRHGAADALDLLGNGAGWKTGKGERIEIGVMTDKALIEAVRDIAAGYGRLVVDTDGDGESRTTSLSIDVDIGADVDALLEMLWQAGADEAFVLHD